MATAPSASDTFESFSLKVSDGSSESTPANMNGLGLAGLIIPAEFDGTEITIEVSDDNSTYYPILFPNWNRIHNHHLGFPIRFPLTLRNSRVSLPQVGMHHSSDGRYQFHRLCSPPLTKCRGRLP